MSDHGRAVRDKIAAGSYDVSLDESRPLSYEAEESLWRARHAEFKADALREVGLEGHPGADRAFALADKLAGKGLSDVLRLLEGIAGLLLED